MKRYSMIISLAAMMTFFCIGVVSAHGVWVGERLDQKQVVLGEGPGDNAYDPQCVKTVQGYTSDFKKTEVRKLNGKNHVALEITKDTAVIGVAFDYGYWTKGKDGKMYNLPMNQVPGAEKGTHAIKYNVTYLKNVTEVKAIDDVPLQIIPQTDPTKLHKGEEFTVVVVRDGKPLANVEIIPDVINDLTKTVKTDDEGKAVLKVANDGVNVIGVEIAFPVKEKKELATQDKFFSSLTFTLYPEE